MNGIAFYAVLSLLSVKVNLSLAITALLTTPLLLRQVGVPLVDLYFNFTFITAIYFLIHYFKIDEKALYFFALALGLFIGVKYLGLVYAAPLLLVAGIAYVIYQTKTAHIRQKVIQITVLCLIGGGFWYIRNWISVGNPIYPAGVELMGHTILKGYAPINENLAAFSLSANLNSAVRWQEFFMKFTSMLAYSSYLFIVAGFLLLWKGLKDFKQKGYVALMLLLAMLVYFYLYLKSPYSYNNLIPNVRYALMFVCFAFWGIG